VARAQWDAVTLLLSKEDANAVWEDPMMAEFIHSHFQVGGLLSAVWCVLSTVYCLPFCCLLSAVYCLLSAACCLFLPVV
jgi:hypothetical protein